MKNTHFTDLGPPHGITVSVDGHSIGCGSRLYGYAIWQGYSLKESHVTAQCAGCGGRFSWRAPHITPDSTVAEVRQAHCQAVERSTR